MTKFYDEVVIDTVVWVGAKSERDNYYEKSNNIINAFLNKKIKKVIITDYVLIETINFLLRKSGFEFTYDVLNSITESGKIKIRYSDEIFLTKIKEIFEKYKNLSLTDCSIVALMEERKIKYLFSFDSGFDKVKGIIRKETT